MGDPRRQRQIASLPRDHPCATVFLDETGAIARDRYFAVGVVKAPEMAPVLRALQKFRDQKQWYGEIHFTYLKPRALDLYKRVVDLVLDPASGVEFWCFVADRDVADPIVRFGSAWDAYSKLAEQLVHASIRPGEVIAVMADNYSAPDHVLFEQQLRSSVNRRQKRLAVASVCRLDSKCCDGLQIADLLTAAVAHEFRAKAGLASTTGPKAELAAHVRAALGTKSCLGGWRSAAHSVQLYGNGTYQPVAAGN